MLAADKSALQVELSQQILQLQWKELEYLHMNFRSLSTSSAVLVGFGFFRAGYGGDAAEIYGPHSNVFSGTVEWDQWKIYAVCIEGLIGATLSLAVSLNLITLFLSTIAAMTGPGLALRGPEGSVSRAVKHMEKQNKRALRAFGRGITFFCLHLTFLSMRGLFGLGFVDGFTGVFIGCATLSVIMYYGSDVGERFHVSRDRAVRGSFSYDEKGVQQWSSAQEEREQPAEGWAYLSWRPWWAKWAVTLCGKKWRPPGHGRFTPLWRLDKLIAFPWHDDGDDQYGPRRHSDLPPLSAGQRGTQSAAAGHREQVEQVLLRMQGSALSVNPAEGTDRRPTGGGSFQTPTASVSQLNLEGGDLAASRISEDQQPPADLFEMIARKSVDFFTGGPSTDDPNRHSRAGQQSRLLDASAATSEQRRASFAPATPHSPPRRLKHPMSAGAASNEQVLEDGTVVSPV